MHPMRTITRCLFFILAGACAMEPAGAWAQMRGDRIAIAFNVGEQATSNDFSDRITFERYVETGTTDVSYPVRSGLVIDGGGGVRLWKGLGAAVAVSYFTRDGLATTSSQVPHPFFDNQPRTVEGTVNDLARTERAVHVQITWLIDPDGPLRVTVGGGPSVFSLEQEVVTSVDFDEAYPYDTATFAGAGTSTIKESATGFNVGADVAWMFTRNVGAGALLRFARASLDLRAPDGRTIAVDAGGFHVGGGVRLAF